jgi:hypothetical protein
MNLRCSFLFCLLLLLLLLLQVPPPPREQVHFLYFNSENNELQVNIGLESSSAGAAFKLSESTTDYYYHYYN